MQLLELDLHACGIHDAGAAAIAASLHGNKVLTTINLRANYITDASLPASMCGAAPHRSVCVPDFVLAFAVTTVAGALAANTTLTCVNLRSNDFTAYGERHLASLVERHVSITSTGTDGASMESLCCVM